MATSEQRVRQTTVGDGNTVETTRRVDNNVMDPVAEHEHKRDVGVRVVWYVTGVVLGLLGIRFVLALLGANPDSGFVSLVYALTYPLVAPFFGAFSYDYTIGLARFETYTLLAMLVYALIGYAVSRLMTLGSRRDATTTEV